MKGSLRGAFALFVSIVAVACATEAPPERVAEAAPAPVDAGPNYAVRLDSESSDASDFVVVEDDDGIRIQTGPAGITYRETDVIATGGMNVRASFLQLDAPIGYREAYGIFVGGIDLDGEDPEYTYLLVRSTGDFMVKRRIGAITETLADWTAHPSVQVVAKAGDRPRNTLGIDVFGGETHFVVNGDVVYEDAATRVRPYGIAGIRVNHRLDVRVDRWLVESTAGRVQGQTGSH